MPLIPPVEPVNHHADPPVVLSFAPPPSICLGQQPLSRETLPVASPRTMGVVLHAESAACSSVAQPNVFAPTPRYGSWQEAGPVAADDSEGGDGASNGQMIANGQVADAQGDRVEDDAGAGDVRPPPRAGEIVGGGRTARAPMVESGAPSAAVGSSPAEPLEVTEAGGVARGAGGASAEGRGDTAYRTRRNSGAGTLSPPSSPPSSSPCVDGEGRRRGRANAGTDDARGASNRLPYRPSTSSEALSERAGRACGRRRGREQEQVEPQGVVRVPVCSLQALPASRPGPTKRPVRASAARACAVEGGVAPPTAVAKGGTGVRVHSHMDSDGSDAMARVDAVLESGSWRVGDGGREDLQEIGGCASTQSPALSSSSSASPPAHESGTGAMEVCSTITSTSIDDASPDAVLDAPSGEGRALQRALRSGDRDAQGGNLNLPSPPSATSAAPSSDKGGHGMDVEVDAGDGPQGVSRSSEGRGDEGERDGGRAEDEPVPCMLLFDSTKGHRSQEMFKMVRK